MNILIIEDDENIAKCINYLLKVECDVFSAIAYTYSQAISILKTIKVDLIILDYFLGEHSAEPIMTYIRENLPPTPVILISASSKINEMHVQMQTTYALEKPFDSKKINRLIEIINENKK